MATESRLSLVIEAKDLSKRALRKAGRNIRGFTARARSRFQRLRRAVFSVRGAIAGLAAAGAIASITKKIFDLGADAVETANKFRRVFGPAVKDMSSFLDDWRRMAGLARSEARELAAQAGGLARAFNFGTDEAASFSEEILKTAGDMASFNNVSAERSTRAIISALTGEREALKNLNVVIRETDVQQKALAMTGKESADAITDQEKALATLQLIQERAAVQMGDLADTQDSAANNAKQLAGAYRDAKEAISEVLLPVLLEVAGQFSDQQEDFKTLADRIRDNRQVIQAWARVVFRSVSFAGQSFKTLIRVAFNLGQTIGDLLQMIVSEAIGRILQMANQAVGALNTLIEGANKLPGVNVDFRFAGFDAEGFLKFSQERWESLKGNIDDAGDSLVNLRDAWREVRRASAEAEAAQQRAAEAGQQAAPAAPGGGGGGGGPLVEPSGLGESPGAGLVTSGLKEPVEGAGQLADGLDIISEKASTAEKALASFGDQASQAFAGALQGAILASEGMKKGFLGSIAQMAAGKASFYAAEAIAAVARGLLFNDPKAFAAAEKYAQAAAAMTAVAATVGAGAAAVAGGGGGGGSPARFAQQTRRDQDRRSQQQGPQTTIIVKGGFLNLNDPRQRRQLEKVLNGAGSLGSVTIKTE